MSRRWRLLLTLSLTLSLAAPAAAPLVAADVSWPASPDLVVGEIVTGGDSGSDEYIELYNAGDRSVGLGGLEVVYVSASGKSVTRKHKWDGRSLGPGEHLLLANSDGVHAPAADGTYSGGLSAAGGSVVIRAIGAEVIDALSWGTAASAFVEGKPGVAPAAGSSLERRPGGVDGNGRDTNDNAADTVINPKPLAGGSTPTPVPTLRPTPEPTPKPTPEPTPVPAPESTPVPTPVPTPSPTAPPEPIPTQSLTPEPTPGPTEAPTPAPTPTLAPEPPAEPTPPSTPEPAPSATAEPSPPATAEPAPTPQPTIPRPATVPIAEARALGVGEQVAVAGTVTATPGQIIGERTMVIADHSGGIAVRVPTDHPHAELGHGAIVEVSGTLAQPYGNLEIRPKGASDIVVIGSGGLPEPLVTTSTGIREANEGLLVRLAATLTDIDRYSSGSLSLTVSDEAGPARVFVFSMIGFDPDVLERGRRIQATGIVGQRASSSGATDGHRLWPRSTGDIITLDDGPTDDGPTDDGPAAPPPRTEAPADDAAAAKPPRVTIAAATPGRVVTIVGVVTSEAGLIDSEGRRVTIQDRTGAILVRYPAETRPPAVGRVIRASGEVGTWYGALQLEADQTPQRRGRRRVVPTVLRSPPGAAQESSLVSVTVRIMDIERSGDTWRAEASLPSGAQLPIVGLAGSGVPADLLEPGRGARITGIVRRAHPSASDQRFAVAPRSRKDIKLRGLATVADDDDADDDDDALASAAGPDDADMVTAVTLDSLDGLGGRTVRVGGRVTDVGDRRWTLDDGTARCQVRLAAGARQVDPALEIDEVVNVTGSVRQRRAGGAEVVVASGSDVRRAAVLGDLRRRPGPTSSFQPVAGMLGRPVAEAPAAATEASPMPSLDVLLLIAGAILGSAAGLLLVLAAISARRGVRLPPTPG